MVVDDAVAVAAVDDDDDAPPPLLLLLSPPVPPPDVRPPKSNLYGASLAAALGKSILDKHLPELLKMRISVVEKLLLLSTATGSVTTAMGPPWGQPATLVIVDVCNNCRISRRSSIKNC